MEDDTPKYTTMDQVIEAMKAGAEITYDIHFSEVAAPDEFMKVGDDYIHEEESHDVYYAIYGLIRDSGLYADLDPAPIQDTRFKVELHDGNWHHLYTITLAE